MVTKKLFGLCKGREVYSLTIDNGTIQAEILSFGATLRSLVFRGLDLCLGYDSLEEYMENDGYVGACVGRHANRIAGSRFTLGNRDFFLSANEGDNQLHGGIEGFSHKVWDFVCGENDVTFSLDSPDGDEGFPGNIHVEICFSLVGSTLSIDYQAKSDADTVVNLTNHAYFNLGGHASGAVYDHRLWINSHEYTPCGPGTIPTGDIASVEESALDFRSPTRLGERLKDPRLDITKGLDHNFVLSGDHACTLFCPETGISLEVHTTMEGMQVYSAGFLSPRKGKGGAHYAQHHAVCLETQHFPDAVHHPDFPSSVLRAGEEYRHWTRFVFKIK